MNPDRVSWVFGGMPTCVPKNHHYIDYSRTSDHRPEGNAFGWRFPACIRDR